MRRAEEGEIGVSIRDEVERTETDEEICHGRKGSEDIQQGYTESTAEQVKTSDDQPDAGNPSESYTELLHL
jgi:hypothetical protein